MNRRIFFVCWVLSAASCSSSAWAVQQTGPQYSRAYNQCMKAVEEGDYLPVQGDYATLECIDAEIGRQDARLNQAYKMVMTRLTPPQKQKLRESERAWIRSKERVCLERMEGDGTMDRVFFASCILQKTVQRTRYLEQYRP